MTTMKTCYRLGVILLSMGVAPAIVRDKPCFHKIIDTRTLETRAIPSGEFDKAWNGYALVIRSCDPKSPLPKPPDDSGLTPEQKAPTGLCDVTWDFGIVDSGVLPEHTFSIDPNGIRPDEIKMFGKSCTCIEAQLGQDTHGHACLTLKLRVREAGWPQAEVMLQLPGDVIKRYGVRAFGRAMFTVRSDKGFVEMPHAGEVTYPVEVTYYTDANDFIDFAFTRTSIPGIRTGEVTRQEEVLNNGAMKHTFIVPLSYRLESELDAVVRQTVDFLFDTSGGQKLVALEMTIKAGAEPVKMLPQRLFLLVSDSEAPPGRQVKLEFAARPPDEVVARVVGDLPLTVMSSLAGNTCTAEVRVDREAMKNHPTGSRRGVIRFLPMEKGRSGDPIELPVTMLIRR